MFKSKLFKVAYAISIAEGWIVRLDDQYPDGTASYINHNPGNVRYSPFQVGESSNQFSIFENDLVGYFAIVYQLYLYASGKSAHVAATDTIGAAISKYNDEPQDSPAFLNYIQIIETVGGVSRNDLISTILPTNGG